MRTIARSVLERTGRFVKQCAFAPATLIFVFARRMRTALLYLRIVEKIRQAFIIWSKPGGLLDPHMLRSDDLSRVR